MLRLLIPPYSSRALTWAALVVAAISTGCRPHAEPAVTHDETGPRVPVRAALVESVTSLATEEVVGTIRSKLRASVEAKVTARIEKMLVAPGQPVSAGELLVQLDTREIQSRLDQAVPVLRNAETELKRFRSLVAQRAVSQSEFDAIEARSRVAQAAVTEAETMLGYTKIVAPFPGVITRKLADVGDLAQPGRALLEIEDPHVLRLEADVPESLIDGVKLGAKLRVTVAGRAIDGTVSEIAPAADSATRTFLVKLGLPEQTGLRAGRFARVAVPLEESRSLRVPSAAILRRGQLEIAFVMDGDKARLRLVKSGKPSGSEIEVVSGLVSGERIVIEGNAQLRDGQLVEVKP